MILGNDPGNYFREFFFGKNKCTKTSILKWRRCRGVDNKLLEKIKEIINSKSIYLYNKESKLELLHLIYYSMNKKFFK